VAARPSANYLFAHAAVLFGRLRWSRDGEDEVGRPIGNSLVATLIVLAVAADAVNEVLFVQLHVSQRLTIKWIDGYAVQKIWNKLTKNFGDYAVSFAKPFCGQRDNRCIPLCDPSTSDSECRDVIRHKRR
jgi:hypothetical protein